MSVNEPAGTASGEDSWAAVIAVPPLPLRPPHAAVLASTALAATTSASARGTGIFLPVRPWAADKLTALRYSEIASGRLPAAMIGAQRTPARGPPRGDPEGRYR